MGMELILREWMGKEKDYSISYSTYMNLVLYTEGHGYYMKEREKIGRQGDFLQVATYPLCLQKLLLNFLFVLLKMVKLLRIFVKLAEEQGSLPMMFYKNGSNYLQKPLLI